MSTSNNDSLETKVAPYTAKELAIKYGVSYKTLRSWLLPHMAEIGERTSKFFTAKQVRIIFEKLGEPG